MAKQIHKMLLDLHRVCKINGKLHSYAIPKIDVNFQEKQKMIDEFNKLLMDCNRIMTLL